MLFSKRITALESANAALTTERDGLQSKVTVLEGQINAAGDAPARLVSVTGERDAALSDLKAARVEIETLKTGAQTAAVIGAELAVEIASSVSVPPVAKEVPPTSGGKLTGSALLEKYEAMTDPAARTAFLMANKDAIYAASAAR